MEKSLRNETSFSSKILDGICLSMDGNDEKFYQERSAWAKKIGCREAKAVSVVPDELITGHELDCRVEEGMEKQEVNDKVSSGINLATMLQLDDHCPPLFGTASLSSSNSYSAELPSSHNESFPYATPRKSCLATTERAKPVRTRVSPGWEQTSILSMAYCRGKKSNTKGESLIKSKSRALKVYAKKLKVLICPVRRQLTKFIRKLLLCEHSMKITNKMIHFRGDVERKPECSTLASSTSSSPASFPNPCLSNGCRANGSNAAKRRRVTFHPVSVIVDEDGFPCGHKCIYDQNADKFDGPPIPVAQKVFKTSYDLDQDENEDTLKMGTKGVEDENFDEGKVEGVDGDEDEAASDCRWDLLEIDHLALVGKIELVRKNFKILKLSIEATAEPSNYHSN